MSIAGAQLESRFAWRMFLAGGLAATVLYFLLPSGGLAQAYLFVAVQGLVVVALAVGIRVNRAARVGIWKVLLAGQAVYLCANLFWYVEPLERGGELSFPSWADPLFVLAYLTMAAGLVALVRARSRGLNRTDFVDASIITLGLAIVLWVFQIQRTYDVSGISALGEVFTLAYPLLDLILLALAVRLVVGGGTKGPAFWLLLASVIAQLIADIGYAEAVLGGTFSYGTPQFAGWLIAYILLGTAALHPSMREIARPDGRRVLVVDDNATNRVVLHDQLTAWEMCPEVSDDAQAALAALRQAAAGGAPFELALLDMCMPQTNGMELARLIAADPELAATRLVMLTSAAEIDWAAAHEVGIAASLTKPVRQSQLYDCLMRVTDPGPERSRPLRRVAAGRGFRGRVLVVEDNPTNQMVALGILDELRFQADVAGNGLEALEALDRREYAAVLMDCQMPEMDGFEATTEIRRREGPGHRVPIIAMTAGALEGAREECLTAGMDDYISKPVTPGDVDAALERWLGGDPGERVVKEPVVESTTSEKAVDVARLDVLRGMGPRDGSLLVTLVDAFLSEAPASLAQLHEATARGDGKALQQGAHRLRGSSANVGASGAAARCGELEALGAAGDLSTAPDLLRGLEAELDQVGVELRAVASGALT